MSVGKIVSSFSYPFACNCHGMFVTFTVVAKRHLGLAQTNCVLSSADSIELFKLGLLNILVKGDFMLARRVRKWRLVVVIVLVTAGVVVVGIKSRREAQSAFGGRGIF